MEKVRDGFLDFFVVAARQSCENLPVGLRPRMPCTNERHGNKAPRRRPISRPWRLPDRVDLRQPPAQNGWRPARLVRQSVDALILDTHVRERSFKRFMVEQFDGNVRLLINRIAGPNNDARTSPVERHDLTLGFLGANDRNDRRGRLRHRSQRVRRLEHDSLIDVVSRHVFVSQ